MKRLTLLTLVIICVLCMATGCIKKDSMENIDIITSSYPIEYLITELYGENATIQNIFPDGETIDTYTFNNKQYKNFSSKDLFIYNGKNASDIALELLNNNDDLLLIDSTLGMEYTYGVEELWLDPSNMLMMALNIKNGLEEYISNTYLIKEIDEAYLDLKVTLSELDAEITLTVQNADDTTIVATDSSLAFLEKYGFTVIVLNENSLDKTYQEVRSLIKNDSVSHIYAFEDDEIIDEIQEIIDDTDVEITYLYRLDSISDDQRNNNKDYVSIMEDNLDLLKLDMYDE